MTGRQRAPAASSRPCAQPGAASSRIGRGMAVRGNAAGEKTTGQRPDRPARRRGAICASRRGAWRGPSTRRAAPARGRRCGHPASHRGPRPWVPAGGGARLGRCVRRGSRRLRWTAHRHRGVRKTNVAGVARRGRGIATIFRERAGPRRIWHRDRAAACAAPRQVAPASLGRPPPVLMDGRSLDACPTHVNRFIRMKRSILESSCRGCWAILPGFRNRSGPSTKSAA